MTFNAGSTTIDSRSLAATLAPVLVNSCDGRLGEIFWFKTDWQRGGAATGRASYRRDDGGEVQVIVKLPVVQRELMWMRRLQENGGETGVVPKLFAGDETLAGYDLAWLVIERFEFGPLGLHWHDDHVPRVVDAAVRFHAAASKYPVDQVPTAEPWDELLEAASESVRVNDLPQRQRWSGALKAMRGRCTKLAREWNARDESQWLHGDLHLANAMSRVAAEHGPVSLIDLAEVHAGHWVEDAMYLERQLWARPDRLKICKPLKEMAAARKRMGLEVDGEYPRLAMIRRALLAATAPKFIKHEGHPAYLEACLNWLEIALTELR